MCTTTPPIFQSPVMIYTPHALRMTTSSDHNLQRYIYNPSTRKELSCMETFL